MKTYAEYLQMVESALSKQLLHFVVLLIGLAAQDAQHAGQLVHGIKHGLGGSLRAVLVKRSVRLAHQLKQLADGVGGVQMLKLAARHGERSQGLASKRHVIGVRQNCDMGHLNEGRHERGFGNKVHDVALAGS